MPYANGQEPPLPLPPVEVLQVVRVQPPPPLDFGTTREYQIQVEPPGPERVFRLESERSLRERIRQEFRQRNDRAEFPKDVSLAGEKLPERNWAPAAAVKFPHVVCHSPLYFEDKNTERYAWDFPVLQPVISTAKFYCDLITLPYQIGVQPPWSCDCHTSYDLPGQPVPYYVYVPPFSWKGAALQTATVVGGVAVLP